MAGAAAVVVEVDAAVRRLKAEFEHPLLAVAQALAIVRDLLARAEDHAEAAAMMLETHRDRTSLSDVGQSRVKLLAEFVDLRPERRPFDLADERQSCQHADQRSIEGSGMRNIAHRLEPVHQLGL